MSQSLTLTPNAAAKVLELIQEEGKPDLKLRVYVTGGGCSGFQYGLTFDKNKQVDDIEVVFAHGPDQVGVLVDSVSLHYLNGAKIDYSEDDIQGGQIIIENPNAASTCGCGSSFAT